MKRYFYLMRFHRPVGILLLLWPTLWALWIASNGHPTVKNLGIFISGVIIMRAAGCVINDIADRQLDRHVTRTKDRPLTTGKIKTRQALLLFIGLCAIAFLLVLFTNQKTILLSFGAVAVAMLYPFMKRYTHWPQLVLGIAFSFSIPMAFTAENHAMNLSCWLLFFANIAWTIAYDTQYAIVDREDDLKIGIKSTAILFGKYDRVMIGLLQTTMLCLLVFLGWQQSFSIGYFFGLLVAGVLFIYQYFLIPTRSFDAFLNNQWVGFVIFLGILFHLTQLFISIS